MKKVKCNKADVNCSSCFHATDHIPNPFCNDEKQNCIMLRVGVKCEDVPMNGIKFDGSKLDWTLIPFETLEEVVRVLEAGSRKYSRDNWRNVEPHRERYGAAIMRHFVAWYNGEQMDKETNLNHLAHLICCAMFLLWHDLNKKG